MRHQVMVIGLGRFGTAVALELSELGHEVLALDRSDDAVNEIAPKVTHAMQVDATDEDALRAALSPLVFDVALLPINGRDAEREARGIVGNMDQAEAVELAAEIGATTLVPYHWDGIEGNTASPGAAVDLADGRLHVVVPARFRPIELSDGRG